MNVSFYLLYGKIQDCLIEAASLEVPIISSDCPNGPIEILSNGKGGFIYKSYNLKFYRNF